MNKNWLLLGVSILFSLMILEFAVRFVEKEKPQKNVSTPNLTGTWVIPPEQIWTEPHFLLGWFHQKNKSAVLKKGEIEVPVNTNSYGFRSAMEYSKERTLGTARVLSLGDSFVFGWGVKDNETFSAQLEKNTGTEVINLGSSGYGTDQILLSYREIGKAFNPDFVVIGVYPEDFWRATRAYTDAGYGKPYFVLTKDNQLELKNSPTQTPAALGYVQFPEVVEYPFLERILLKSVLYRFLRKKTLRLARDFGWIDPDLTEDWQLGQRILKQLIYEIKEAGAQPIILMIPPSRWMTNTKPTSVQKSLKRFAERENVEIVDPTSELIDAVAKSNLADFYFKSDDHWTQKAHELVAQQLAQRLNLKWDPKAS